MTISDLLRAGEPPVQLSASQQRFRDLIAAAEAVPLQTMDVEITIGEVTAVLTFTELRGVEWADISCYAPRPGNVEDARLGCNADEVFTRYPVDRITCAGENPSSDEWRRLCALIHTNARADIVIALWWMHVETYRQDREVAEAVADKRGEHQ